MILIDYKEKILKFVIYINLLLLVLLAAKTFFYKETNNKDTNFVSTSTIQSETDTTSIYVEYPRFNDNDEVNKIISDEIYAYIKEFKSYECDKSLDITYKLYYVSDYVNVTFHIENTLSQVKNRNILLNLQTNQIDNISSLYDSNLLSHTIDKLVANKYSEEVYKKIFNGEENINDFTYIIDSDNVEVYFNNTNWDDYDYVPYVAIDLTENITYTNTNNKKKYIAFTYDVGSFNYTEDMINVLENNNASATFFVYGNKISGKEDSIKKISDSKSEVAVHGYTDTSFNTLTKEVIANEINTTNSILSNISKNKKGFIRPPYGEYNDNVLSLGYDLVLWNIDSKDWIVRDENKIYNNVIKNACDGCIVLMHDDYIETLGATKRLLPELKKRGYTVVSVSKLMEKKNYERSNNPVINYIK